MPQYKLIYFNGMGHGEIIRWLFEYSGIDYKDERLTREEFMKIKPTIRGGKLPVLDVDGKQIPQSLAIARFVAKKGGLIPEDDLQAAFCDAIADSLHELLFNLYQLRRVTPDYQEMVKKFKADFFPNEVAPIVDGLDKLFKEREWFVGNKISWGDIVIGRAFAEMYKREPEAFQKYDHLRNHVEKVCALPAIKKWIATRPETPF